jgi:hypothetical protein
MIDRRRTWLTLVACAAAALIHVQHAAAQLSGATGGTGTSSCSGSNNADGFCGFSRQTLVNSGTTFQSRYAWNINADVGAGSTRDTSSNAQHVLSFTATAPGSYQLNISTTRVGMVQRNDDTPGCDGQAHIAAMTGSSNIALNSGGLGTGALDVNNGGGNNQQNLSQSNSAVIGPRLSNGVGQGHSLTFSWSGSVRSNSCEAAVRLGQQNGSTTSCGACQYAGTPSRTQSSDGNFVTVTFTSFCGDGAVNGTGEQCDLGGSNGASTSCCNSNCTFRAGGSVCRTSGGV